MTPFASSNDLRARWPSLPTDQDDVANTQLADASLLLSTQYPGVGDQASTDQDLADVLTIVVCGMAKRAMLSMTPGVSQESTATGPYNHSVTYSNPNGNLFVTAVEDAMIRGYRPRATTVSMAQDVV